MSSEPRHPIRVLQVIRPAVGERIDQAAATLLRQAGVASIETGPQTSGAAALEACHRPFDEARFTAGVSALKEGQLSPRG